MSELALVALLGFFGLLAYLAYLAVSHLRSVRPASETWDVQSDEHGIPQRIKVTRE
ncbi:MAG: hypothetical protein JRD89_07130 [Deltaproteobacteria bacterium]|nr:hypothetical protein [Deltaproteobacteria bacterium]